MAHRAAAGRQRDRPRPSSPTSCSRCPTRRAAGGAALEAVARADREKGLARGGIKPEAQHPLSLRRDFPALWKRLGGRGRAGQEVEAVAAAATPSGSPGAIADSTCASSGSPSSRRRAAQLAADALQAAARSAKGIGHAGQRLGPAVAAIAGAAGDRRSVRPARHMEARRRRRRRARSPSWSTIWCSCSSSGRAGPEELSCQVTPCSPPPRPTPAKASAIRFRRRASAARDHRHRRPGRGEQRRGRPRRAGSPRRAAHGRCRDHRARAPCQRRRRPRSLTGADDQRDRKLPAADGHRRQRHCRPPGQHPRRARSRHSAAGAGRVVGHRRGTADDHPDDRPRAHAHRPRWRVGDGQCGRRGARGSGTPRGRRQAVAGPW